MAEKNASPEDVLLKLSENVLLMAEALKGLRDQIQDLQDNLRDGAYSDGFDPEAFHKLTLDVADIERRTRNGQITLNH